MFKEFNRQFHKDCIERFKRFWNPDRIDKVLTIAKRKKDVERFIEQIGTTSTVDVPRKLCFYVASNLIDCSVIRSSVW